MVRLDGTTRRYDQMVHAAHAAHAPTQLCGAHGTSAAGAKWSPAVPDRVLDPRVLEDLHSPLGPSGSGKSSLLRALAAAVPLAAGSLTLSGGTLASRGAARWRASVLYVRQEGGRGVLDADYLPIPPQISPRLAFLETRVFAQTLVCS